MKCVSAIECIEFPSTIHCSIDLIEPIQVVDGNQIEVALKLEPDEMYDLDFLYKVGYPAADAFYLFFYNSPENVRDVMQSGVDPTRDQVTPNPAITYSFLPILPVVDETGIKEQRGTLHVSTPETMGHTYYAILAMSHP